MLLYTFILVDLYNFAFFNRQQSIYCFAKVSGKLIFQGSTEVVSFLLPLIKTEQLRRALTKLYNVTYELVQLGVSVL